MRNTTVAPRVGAWIETAIRIVGKLYLMGSHPVWVRGLKPHQGAFGTMPPRLRMESHPVWVRGLKLSTAFANDQECLVAPRVGAWIETVNRSPYCHFFLCRTPCGCVD